MEREIVAWEEPHNDSGAHITCLFHLEKARNKLARSYPVPATPPVFRSPPEHSSSGFDLWAKTLAHL